MYSASLEYHYLEDLEKVISLQNMYLHRMGKAFFIFY